MSILVTLHDTFLTELNRYVFCPLHSNNLFLGLQVLFPYDDFVNLFNWDKPGFPPCGLLNCGNRFTFFTRYTTDTLELEDSVEFNL